MLSYKIKIPLTPKPKVSVRLTSKGQAWNPSAKGMAITRKLVQEQLKYGPLEGPLLVVVHYKIPLACSIKHKLRRAMHEYPHVSRPDGDNLDKFLFDALTGVCWTDDSQIVWLLRSKTRTQEDVGETSLYVEQIAFDQPNYFELTESLSKQIYVSYDDED